MREAVGERPMAVGARLSADELTPGGMTSQDCVEVRACTCTGAGCWTSSRSCSATPRSRRPRPGSPLPRPRPPPPSPLPAAAVRAAIPQQLPVLATTRVVDLGAADRLIPDGVADLVGMTRALIADPELIAKTLAGHADEVIECIGCNQACIGHYHAGVPIGCAVNARTGRELTLAAATTTSRHASGPPGGCSSSAADRPAPPRRSRPRAPGDDVTLVEREPELGGQLRLAGLAPAHRELWERYRALHHRPAARRRGHAPARHRGRCRARRRL